MKFDWDKIQSEEKCIIFNNETELNEFLKHLDLEIGQDTKRSLLDGTAAFEVTNSFRKIKKTKFLKNNDVRNIQEYIIEEQEIIYDVEKIKEEGKWLLFSSKEELDAFKKQFNETY